MIHDKINNLKLYFKKSISEELINQLKDYNVDTPNGIYKNHESFYFKVMSYSTKHEPLVTESHMKEVDFQIILKGKERIKLYDRERVKIKENYNEESDCQFYDVINDPISEIIIEPGNLAIFFPDDIHQPQFVVDNKIEVLKKIVIKVDEKFLTQL